MRRTSLLLFFVFMYVAAKCQTAASYTYARSTGTFTSISGGAGTVATTDISDDDETKTDIPIGFAFSFCGTTYTSLSACSNGWISLANSNATDYTNSAANIAGAGFLMAFWDDLDGGSASETAFYQTSGVAPNRIFTFQWGNGTPNNQRWSNITGTGRAIWQVKLYESSNVIQYIYGAGNFSGNSATIGIANSSSDRRTITSATATTSGTTFSTGVSASPAANSVMTWTPPPGIAVTPSTLVFTTGVSTTTSPLDVTLRAFGLTSGSVTVTAPANFQVFNGTAWVSSMTVSTVTVTVGSYINTPVQVRFVGPATIGTYTGTLSFASTGATTQNVALTGDVTPPCSGTPTPGTITATATSGACTPYSSTLSLSGATAAAGITYQWQSSPDNLSWTDITGATNATYSLTVSTTSYIRARLTCSSSSAYTAGVLLTYTSCIIMPSSGTSSTTSCGGAFYDSGGPSGEYTDDQSGTFTIYPGSPGSKVTVTFSSLFIEGCCDYLRVYNGNNTGAPLLGTYNGEPNSSVPFTLTSTAADGSLTFNFTSDGSVTYSGWTATIGNTNPNPITAQPAASTATCQGATGVSVNLTASGTNTYQWYNNGTTNSTSGGTLIAGATNASYAPSTAATGTTYYYAVVKNACNVTFATSTAAIVVNALPAAISGSSVVCEASTTTFTNSTTGGTWSSSNSAIATVGSGTGAVTGVTGGTAYISYIKLGCSSTKVITVNPLPATITGTLSVCATATTTVNTVSSGGTWTSGTTSIATIDPSTGVISGAAAGLAIITYTLPTTCIRTAQLTVNPLPNLTVSPATTANVCIGNGTTFTADAPVSPFTLLAQDFNSGIGTWSIVNTAGTAAGYFQITPSPGYAGTPGDNSPMLQAASEASGAVITKLISPSFSTVGYGSASLTFNQYLISTTPDASVAIDYSTNGGTTWTNLLEQVNLFSGSGSWTSASPEVVIPLPAGALGQADVKLRWNYDASSFYWFIDNISVQALLPAATYAWTGAAGLSCGNCANPTITPTATGANLYTVTATTSAGCIASTGVQVSVNPLPAAISGNLQVCEGANVILGNSMSGGTWLSSDVAKGTINSTSGVFTGILAGTSTVTYTLATGCAITAVVTVDQSPAAITGTASVCAGLTTALSQSFTTGNWSTSSSAIASVDVTGIVTGNSAGNADISYILPVTGCYAIRTVTVNPLPAAIGGPSAVCVGSTIQLTDADAGGTWQSSNPASASAFSTGEVTGAAAGITNITYTLPTTCIISKEVTVNSTPEAITGTLSVCAGLNTALTNATPLGTWSSSAAPVATVNGSGLVSGIAAGNASISYTLSNGCYVTAPVTVNALPADIGGSLSVCVNSTTTLSNTTANGTWSSSNTSNAVVNTTGTVTGIHDGTATITYTLSTGCIKTAVVTINALPTNILGDLAVCENATTTLSSLTADGSWTSETPAIASVNASGLVSGNAAGTAHITYTLSTGCNAISIVTVNHTPVANTGNPEVCKGLATSLVNPEGAGNWSSSASSIATVDAFGTVTGVAAGNADITFALFTGCYTVSAFTVNPLPANIIGPAVVCQQASITLTDASANGTWSVGGTTIASVDGTGIVTGIDEGDETVTYTLPTGCIKTKSTHVNPLPGAISGDLAVCNGLSSALSNSAPNGSWTSSDAATASISSSGLLTGNNTGNAIISYTLPTGCKITAIATVNTQPASISGGNAVCEGAAIALGNTSPNGTWTSSDDATLTVDNSGTVSGVLAGTATVTYTLPTGCIATKTITVKPTPANITGDAEVCAGLTTALSSLTAGGTWSSNAPATATITTGGVVAGLAAGEATIVYTLPAGCTTSVIVTVNPLPAPIVGNTTICQGLTSALTNTSVNGTWSSSTTSVATIATDGVVTAVAAGGATITYTLPTGCISTTAFSVNPLPAAIVGNTNVCVGQGTALSDATAGGTWSSSDPSILLVTNAGVAAGVAAGFAIVTYTLPTSCISVMPIVVNAVPAAITGNTGVCAGLTTSLSNATVNGSWTSATSVATVDENGIVTGVAAGTTFITYTLGTGCFKTRIVTVNPLPDLITGSFNVCQGLTATLSNATTGGTWMSSDATIASIDETAGIVSGVANGNATITYTLPTGCLRTRGMNVNPAVAEITGTAAVCKGLTTTLATASTGGVWISNNTAVATVISTTGEVTGVVAGTAAITYALPTGCIATRLVTVNPLPTSIIGASNICLGATTTLTNASAGGAWSSNDPTVAGIDATSGVVTGVSAGSTAIMYTLPTGCVRTAALVVDPLPQVQNLTGGGSYCEGGTGVAATLDGSATATTYTLYNGAMATATFAGTGNLIELGMLTTPGTYSVTATSATGCTSNMSGTATVNIVPVVVPAVMITSDNGDNVCAGTLTTYTATPTNGGATPAFNWSVNGTSMGTAATFAYTPANGDIIIATLTSSATCAAPLTASDHIAMTVTANELPTVAITSTATDTLCMNDAVTFHAISAFGGTAPVYTWMKNGVSTGAGGDEFTYNPANGDVISLQMSSNYRCRTANNATSNTITLTVDSVYVPLVTIAADPGLDIARGQTVTLTAAVSGAGPSPHYQWTVNGFTITGATTNKYTSHAFMNGDSVTCYVYGTGKCGKQSFNTVRMSVGTNGFSQPTASAADITLIPNPNNGSFVISGTLGTIANETAKIEITDVLGQVVFKTNTMLNGGKLNERIQLNTMLANGMYLLNISTATDHTVLHFVLKQ